MIKEVVSLEVFEVHVDPNAVQANLFRDLNIYLYFYMCYKVKR